MSDQREPEVKAADEQLLDAITNRLRADGTLREDEVVESFVIAAHVDGIGLRERGRSRYAYLTRDSGEGPDAADLHELRGLAVLLDEWLLNAWDEPEGEG